jgi:hypothetical protein
VVPESQHEGEWPCAEGSYVCQRTPSSKSGRWKVDQFDTTHPSSALSLAYCLSNLAKLMRDCAILKYLLRPIFSMILIPNPDLRASASLSVTP